MTPARARGGKLALRLEEAIATRAKAKQSAFKGNQHVANPQKSAEEHIETREEIAARAKAHQVERKGSQAGATPQKSAELSPIETREEIAKLAGVSPAPIALLQVCCVCVL